MKKSFILFAAATLALAACTKENACNIASEGTITKMMTVENGIWDASKSAYTAGTGVAITGSEKITVYGNVYEEGKTLYNTGVFTATAATPSTGGYTFTHPSIDEASGYNYFFVFPHKTSNQRGGSPQIPQIRLFPVQYPAAGSFDPFCDLVIGKPAVNVAKTSTVEVNEWMRLGAPVEMTIKDDANLLGGEPISIASIYFPGASAPLANMMQIKNAENYSDVVVTRVGNTRCYGLSAVYPDGCAASSGSYKVWYVSMPVDFTSGQEVDLTVSTTKKTLKFKTTLPSDLGFKKDMLNSLTFALTAAKQVDTTEASVVTCFTKLSGSLGTSYASTDGTTRGWGFSGCNLKTSEADGRSYLRTSAAEAVISLPTIADKYYTSIRIYPGENLWNSESNPCNLSLRSNGTEIQTKSMGYYTRDLSEKGYVEFTGITEAQTNLSIAVKYKNGDSHENLIGAIAANYTDITGGGSTDPTPTDEIDYLSIYNAGDDIQIGDLTVNKATYGEAVVVAPSSLTYTILAAGGVVVIDDKAGASVAPDGITTGTKGVATGSKELILIGRWGGIGKQTEIKVSEWRFNKNDATFFNVRLAYSGNTAQMFAMDSGVKLTPSIRMVDCFIDNSAITASNTNIATFLCTNTCTGGKGYGYFKNILLENDVIKLTSVSGKNPVIFYHGVTNAGNFSGDQLYTLRNCVVYCENQMSGRIAYLSTQSGSFEQPNLEVICENNTFYNLTSDGYLTSYTMKGSSFTNNVGYNNYSNYSASTTKPYSTKIWLMFGTGVPGTFTISDNKFYRENNPGNGVWTMKNSASKTDFTGSNNNVIDGTPFKKVDTANGYLPLIDALAGYGASYTDKGYISAE